MKCDVSIIGAGPAGSIAGALLCQRGYDVHIVEKQHFPRFSIGESLLPQCMEFIEKAGMLEAVEAACFQFKAGAGFRRGEASASFEFSKKFTSGPSSTFQVPRAEFDQILAQQAEKQGVTVQYGTVIDGIDLSHEPILNLTSNDGTAHKLESKFILDASGFGRVLTRLLDLERPSNFPSRVSVFTHIEDRATSGSLNREETLIVVHPEIKDVWYWLIPFSNGRSSLGIVLPEQQYEANAHSSLLEDLKYWIAADDNMSGILSNCEFDMRVQKISGYSCDVKSLWGESFALLGNAGEFLDPIFSSGVTIAMKSADLAVGILDRQLKGESVDWESEFSEPLKQGVNTFRSCVESWYDGGFQDIVFSKNQSNAVRDMICSILAGYAWDLGNPYVKNSKRRIKTLAELCRRQ